MDLFLGDDFPVTPFPETNDFFCSQSHPNSLIHPPGFIAGHHRPPPPQKLRPIRYTGRSPPPPQLPADGKLAVASTDVGFLRNQLVVENGESSHGLDHSVEASKAIDDGRLRTEDPVANGSGHRTHMRDPDTERCPLELEFGSSSDDDDKNSSGIKKEPGSGKRKKKSMKEFKVFLGNLVRKVMEKQEQMHKQLMDFIEKKERERVMREEAWKQKEMERIKKDEEARLQERSRNLALISVLQNLMGCEIQIPQPAVSSLRADDIDEGEANIQQDLKSDFGKNRWPEAEVQALITLRTSLEHKFQLLGSKGSIWVEISEAMHKMGYNRSAKKCREKWENINKYYKRTIGSGKKRRLNSKSCLYFKELDILYRNGLLNAENSLSNTNNNVAKTKED